MGHATSAWMNSAAVRKAIHVPDDEFYGGPWPSRGMRYSTYTHASIDLYPSLLAKYVHRPSPCAQSADKQADSTMSYIHSTTMT